MVKNPDSYQNRYSYIPPSAQKSIKSHLDRTMPVNLRKYHNNETRHVPGHAEKQMLDHMEKTLPGHLKKYADPYLQQNVVWSGNSGSGPAPSSEPAAAPQAGSFFSPGSKQHFSDINKAPSQTPSSISSSSGQSANQNPYDFIMNPQKPPRPSLNFFTGGGTAKKAIIAGAGLILLIIVLSVFSSFLNGASNAQKDRLLAVATAQAEIINVTSTTNTTKLNNDNVADYALNVRLSTESTQNQIVSALAGRGKKLKSTQITGNNPADAAALQQGEQNGRYDDAFKQLLDQLLVNYQKQLAAAYGPGTTTEKQIMSSANDQIKLLLNSQVTQQ